MTGSAAGETVLRKLTRSSRRALLFGSLVALAGCGSRSRLLEPSQGGGGTGASAQGGGGGSTGGFGGVPTGGGGVGAFGGGVTGGTGGAIVCGSLFSAWPTIEVQHPSGVLDGAPQFAGSSDVTLRLTVALVRQKSPGFRELKHASFLPWQDWPFVVVEPTYDSFASSELSESFALGSSWGNRVALLTSHVTSAGSGITTFSPEVDPTASNAGPSIMLSSGGQPLFVSRGPPAGRHLVATSDGKMLMGHVVTYSGASSSVKDVLLACGNGVTADAVPYEDGWLVALANEPTAPPTGCSAAANGASRLDVVRVGLDGSVSYVLGIDGDMPITRIAAAPHPSGVWVVWRTASGGKVSPLRWARFDVPSAGLVGPGDVSTAADYPLDDFDAAALGSQLVVAWGNDPAGNPPDLTLTLLDPNGGTLQSLASEPPFVGPLSLATSPDGMHVVVGWCEPDLSGGTAAKLARYDCYGGI